MELEPTQILSELAEAARKKDHPFRWPVLSTADADGRPDARIVVLRSCEEGIAAIYSDARTGKIRQLSSRPHATLLFFDPTRMLQIRASGEASVHCGDRLAENHWKNLPEARRKEYQSTAAPGTDWTTAAAQRDERLGSRHFAVLRLCFRQLEVLRLAREEHQRVLLQHDTGSWVRRRVVP